MTIVSGLNGLGTHAPGFIPYSPSLLASMAASASPASMAHLPSLIPPMPSSAASLSSMMAAAAAAQASADSHASANVFRPSVVPSPPVPPLSQQLMQTHMKPDRNNPTPKSDSSSASAPASAGEQQAI